MTLAHLTVIDAGIPRPSERVTGVSKLTSPGKVIDVFKGVSGKTYARVWDTVSGATYWNRVKGGN